MKCEESFSKNELREDFRFMKLNTHTHTLYLILKEDCGIDMFNKGSQMGINLFLNS